MSYFVFDRNGKAKDLCNNAGLLKLRDDPQCPEPLAVFLDTGRADTEAECEAIAEACSKVEAFRFIADIFELLEAPVILTDGVIQTDGEDDKED